MAWIESHQTLARHPKTRKLARLLDIPVPQVLGHLHLLWWWATDYAQDGDLTAFDNADIADGAMWEGDPDGFIKALAECGAGGNVGFLELTDLGYMIHDWDEYAGKLIERRKVDAERKKSSRQPRDGNTPSLLKADTSSGHPTDIQGTAHVPNTTVPNIPNTTNKQTKPAASAPAVESVSDFDSIFETIWREYPVREGVSKIGKAETKTMVKALGPSVWPDVLKAVRNYAQSGRLPVDPIRFFKSRDFVNGLWREFVNGGNGNGTNKQNGAANGVSQGNGQTRSPGLRDILEKRASAHEAT